jgi:hypothetical protein
MADSLIVLVRLEYNQWLKRPLLIGISIERNGFQRAKRKKIVYIVYILYIVSLPYAPELHQNRAK